MHNIISQIQNIEISTTIEHLAPTVQDSQKTTLHILKGQS